MRVRFVPRQHVDNLIKNIERAPHNFNMKKTITINLRVERDWEWVDERLRKIGYKPHKRGWIKKVDKDNRFHIDFLKDGYMTLHKDITIDGYHNAVCDSSVRKEANIVDNKLRGKKYQEIKNKNKKSSVKVAKMSEIPKYSVIVRSKYNPLRYLFGKFKYIQK